MVRWTITFFLTAVFFSWTVAPEQTVDWAALTGKWECKKVVLVWGVDSLNNKDSIDMSAHYIPYFCTYSKNFKYKEKYPAVDVKITGEYILDKTQKKIGFIGMGIMSPALPDPPPHQYHKTWKPDVYVIKLTADTLVVAQKYDSFPSPGKYQYAYPGIQTQYYDYHGDYFFYYKKVK